MNKIGCVAIALAMLSGCNREDTGKMVVPKHEMKPHCVGRHMLDMPSSFALSHGTTGSFKAVGLDQQVPHIEVLVNGSGLTRAQFAAALVQREAELKSMGSDTNALTLSKRLSDEATLFRVLRIGDAYISEIGFLRGSSFVTVSVESYHGQFLAAEDRLLAFMAGVEETDTSKPGGRGFCLGPLTIRGDFNVESAYQLYRDEADKGVDFKVQVSTWQDDDEVPLLQRVSGPNSLLTKFKVGETVLRARELNVGGMRAQEWLSSVRLGETRTEKKFKFVLETMRPTPAKAAAHIHLTFDTGTARADGSVNAYVMPDEQAVAQWDAVVRSIRPAQ